MMTEWGRTGEAWYGPLGKHPIVSNGWFPIYRYSFSDLSFAVTIHALPKSAPLYSTIRGYKAVIARVSTNRNTFLDLN